jgi:glycerol-3-phosphate acyltransferase PlsY
MNRLTPTLLAGAAGYLAGSIPSADIATRLAGTSVNDLRAAGSGNPGALNASVLLGRRGVSPYSAPTWLRARPPGSSDARS